MTDKSVPGLIVAARAVVAYASPIQHIVEYHSENSQTFQVAGYFVPEDKINDLRSSLAALRQTAEEALARMRDEQ